MSDQPYKILKLDDLKKAVEADVDLGWGIQARPSIPIRNSDGSISMLHPFPGYFLRQSPLATFVACHEIYRGIELLLPEDYSPELSAKCEQLASVLDAKLFKDVGLL